MDSNLQRWSMIVFWDQTDLDRLHDKETQMWSLDRSWERNPAGRRPKPWELAFSMLLEDMVAKYQLRPYWDEKMPTDIQAQRLRDFSRLIFPAWKRIQSDWETRSIRDREVEPEIQMLHACDKAVIETGQRPQRVWADQAAIDKIRKKATMSSQFGEVWGNR